MAKLQFIRGAVTGKLGEFVGAKWKGINYIRLHSVPANPRTEGQVSVRKIFKKISLFASALFSIGLLDLIPPAKKMTERNSVFKANKQMFTDKIFSPKNLQVAKANCPSNLINIICKKTGNVITAEANMKVSNIVTGRVYAILYDFVKDVIIDVTSITTEPMAEDGEAILSEKELEPPVNFNTPDGSQIADCRLYVFCAGVGADEKKLITATYSAPIA